ncbi:MAG: ion channel, partial [Planctomycetota bacterium]|nr:ion channel [Planctomycetota bacterium]
MSDPVERQLPQRGQTALKRGALVLVFSTAVYYLMGCLCGMNARYGKSWTSLDDDQWELSECFYASVITVTTVGYTDLLGTEKCEVWIDDAGRHRWVSNTDGHEDEGFDAETARLEANFSHVTRTL